MALLCIGPGAHAIMEKQTDSVSTSVTKRKCILKYYYYYTMLPGAITNKFRCRCRLGESEGILMNELKLLSALCLCLLSASIQSDWCTVLKAIFIP